MGHAGFPSLLAGVCPGIAPGLRAGHTPWEGAGRGPSRRCWIRSGSRYLVTSPRFCLLWQLIKIPPGFLPTSLLGLQNTTSSCFCPRQAQLLGTESPRGQGGSRVPKTLAVLAAPTARRFHFQLPKLPCSSASPPAKPCLGGFLSSPQPWVLLPLAHKRFGEPPRHWELLGSVWCCRGRSLCSGCHWGCGTGVLLLPKLSCRGRGAATAA